MLYRILIIINLINKTAYSLQKLVISPSRLRSGKSRGVPGSFKLELLINILLLLLFFFSLYYQYFILDVFMIVSLF